MNKIRVYCCGGAGINIGKKLTEYNGLDNLDIAFIDSSASNLGNFNDDQVFLIEGMDGAGKVRAKTYESFQHEVESVLTMFKPHQRLNIVISSLSGGTGSIIAPLITRELIKNDHSTIVIGIPSFSSKIEIDNTIKTIQTYNNFSLSEDKPIGIIYPKSRDKRSAVDAEIVSSVVTLSLVSNTEKTEEFDSTDFNHFINYNKVSSLPVGLSMISIRLNSDAKDKDTKDKHSKTRLASTILVVCDPDSEIKGEVPEYLATVLITDPDYINNEKRQDDIRIDNHVGVIAPILDELKGVLDELESESKTSRLNEIELIESDNGGVVL